jgi:hypothetical protein
MRKRYGVAIALAAALWLVPSASADTTTIGSVGSIGTIGSGCGACHDLQFQTALGSPSYVVPAPPAGGPWTITSWSALGGTGDGTGAVEVWRPTATTNEFQLVAIGPEQAFPANTVTTHSVTIPVQPGDHLGILSLGGDFSPIYSSTSAEDIEFGTVGNPTIGQTTGAATSDFPHLTGTFIRVNAAATLTAPSVPVAKKKKCKKKKKHKRSAESAKKKKCKKRKKH